MHSQLSNGAKAHFKDPDFIYDPTFCMRTANSFKGNSKRSNGKSSRRLSHAMYDVQVTERDKGDGNAVIRNKIRQFCRRGAPRGFGNLRRMAIYFQGAG